MSVKSGCTSERRRSTSLLHKASHHWRSSASITWQLLSATRPLSIGLLMGNGYKANGRIVAVEQQVIAPPRQRLISESRLADVVRVESEQQPVATVGAQIEVAAARRIDGDQR